MTSDEFDRLWFVVSMLPGVTADTPSYRILPPSLDYGGYSLLYEDSDFLSRAGEQSARLIFIKRLRYDAALEMILEEYNRRRQAND